MTATNVIALHQEESEPTPEELRAIAMNLVAKIRRNVREIIRRREQLSSTARVTERAARVMREAGNPFDQNRIEAREFQAKLLRKSASDYRQMLQDAGRMLVDTAPVIDGVLTLAQRCDLLNINVADRAGLTEEDGFVQLIYMRRLEDSAFYRGKEDWGFDGPLNQAMMLVFMDFLCNHPEGQKLGDSLFEPGGMFENAPRYRQLPDGSMERMPPRLQVVGNSTSIH
jgi:hypothetical protein